MFILTSNDNHAASAAGSFPEPDPHGQAAMLMVESLLHGLIAREVVSAAEAVDIVDTAVEVNEQMAAELGASNPAMERSLALLYSIHMSLSADLPPAKPVQ